MGEKNDLKFISPFLALLIFRLDSARAPLEMSGALENRIGLGPFKLPVRM